MFLSRGLEPHNEEVARCHLGTLSLDGQRVGTRATARLRLTYVTIVVRRMLLSNVTDTRRNRGSQSCGTRRSVILGARCESRQVESCKEPCLATIGDRHSGQADATLQGEAMAEMRFRDYFVQ